MTAMLVPRLACVSFAASVVVPLAACGGHIQPVQPREDAMAGTSVVGTARDGPPDATTENETVADSSMPSRGNDPEDAARPADPRASADAGASPVGLACPATQPANGGSCMPVDWVCEYGDAPNPYCNFLEKCYGQLGGWSNQALPLALCGTGVCPPSYAVALGGQPCSVQNLDCAYPEGQCTCGRKDDAGVLVWSCFSPAGCPEPRPRIGSGCTQDGLLCDYGACAGGVAEKCTAQLGWMQAFPPCPS
jgi:hypothetical protein